MNQIDEIKTWIDNDNNLDLISDYFYIETLEASPVFISVCGKILGNGMPLLKNQYVATLTFFKDKKASWITLKKDQDIISNEIIEMHLNNDDYYNSWFEKWKSRSQEFNKFIDEISIITLSVLSLVELNSIKDKLIQKFYSAREISMFIDGFVFGAERRLSKELEEFCKKQDLNNYSDIYFILTSPEKDSIMNQFEIDLIDVAKKVKDDNVDLNHDLLKLEYIKKHLEKFTWINASWEHGHKYDIDHLIMLIKDLGNKNLEKLRMHKIDINKKHKLDRENLIKRYRFPESIIAISDLTVFFSYWQDLRKENMLKFVFYFTRILEEYSRLFGVDIESLKLLNFDELDDFIIDKEKFIHTINKRKNLFLTIYSDKSAEFIYGPDAEKYFKIINKEITGITKEFKGLPASKGIANGRVCIVKSKNDFIKIQKGDILVTSMTRTDYLPIMKKSSGIITDDGGVTSHAAIISRELGIPCIIGTQVATKVLKDGDTVEVDADNGIVKVTR